MRSTILRCSACDRALSLPDAAGTEVLACRNCGNTTRIWLFPALFVEKNADVAQHVVDEGHSSCMNHPTKKATTVCDGCGKYLCALCDIDWNGEHRCAHCIEHQKNASKDNALRTEYIHYDRIVLMLVLAAIPAHMFLIGVLFSPVAVFIAWRYWNEPWRPVPYRKWGMIVYVSLALMIILATGAFILFAVINI